ncbi:MAG TPA: DinB family protein [Chloroflexia bacterium]|nr:DinB family protein [Chloroflexia bacterium]
MDTLWTSALWRQYGAAIDMLDNALAACPPALWTGRLWTVRAEARDQAPPPPELSAFWYLAYHTIFWLDFYLTAAPEGEFAPPAPYTLSELDPDGAIPDRVYTPEELRAYLAATRRRIHATLTALTDEQAARPIRYPWGRGLALPYLELQIYNLRHVQEHGAQLSLFLGQHDAPPARSWEAFAKEIADPASLLTAGESSDG